MKKLLMMGTAVLVAFGLFVSRSHLRTTIGMVKQSVKDSVPTEFELKRARQMIKDMRPEIEKNMHLIAREETEVAKLERQFAQLQEQLAKDRDDILKLKADLDSGSQTFVYAGVSYTANQVKADLSNRFDAFKTQEATAEARKKVLAARQKGLQAARDKLNAMLAAKRQLEVDVENLEARLKMVQVAQATGEFNFDDSQLSRTRELVEEISDRIQVAERLVNADTRFQDRIPVNEAAAQRDISQEITDYFGDRRAEIEAFVQSED